MVRRLRSALASLVFLKEEEARYTARFVTYLLPAGMVLGLVLIIFPLTPGDLTQRAEALGPVLVAWAVAWSMLRRGKVRRASLVFVLGTWVMATYAAVTRDGVRAPAYLTYLVLVTYAAFLVTPGASLTVFLISLLAGLGMVVAAAMGVLPAPSVIHTPLTLYASYSVSMVMVVAIILMITAEYRDAFGRLRASDEKFRLGFEVARDPIVLLDLKGRFVSGNEAAIEGLGLTSPEELFGGGPADFAPESQPDGASSAERARQFIEEAVSGGSTQFEWTYRRADGAELVAEISLTRIPMKPEDLLFAHVRDITERKRAQAALARRVELEELIIAASTRLINVEPREVNREIDQVLQELGEFARADRAYVFQLRPDGLTVDNTHEWVREGVSVQKHMFEKTPVAGFPWLATRLLRGEAVLVPRVRDLPPEAAAERREFERQDVESLICVPMLLREQAVGFIGFDSVTAEEAWTEETTTLLRAVVEAVTGALTRTRAQEALRESEARFRSLVEATSDWIWEVDIEGRYTYASPKVKELLGYEPQEVVGRTLFDLMPPEEAARVAEVMRPCFEGGQPLVHMENTNLHKDGYPVVLDTSGVPVFDAQGKLLGFRGIDRDVTELKQAEDALRESEALFRTLFEQAMDGVALADLKTLRITMANPRLCQLLGYSEAEVVGRHVWEIHPEETRAEMMETFTAQATGELTTPAEFVMLRKDGSVFLAEIGAKPITLGEQRWLLGVFRDITERKRAEEALREREARYRQFMEISVEGAGRMEITPPIPADADEQEQVRLLLARARVAEANAALAEIYGYPDPEAMVGQRLDDLWKASPDEKAALLLHLIRSGYRVADAETRARRPDGSAGWFLTNIAGVVENGVLGVMWGTLLDITARKQAEEALRESEQRFRAIVESTKDWIWFCDTKGTHRYSNRAVQDVLGYAPEEIVGHAISQFMHPEDVPGARQQMQGAITERRGWSSFVTRWRHKEGGYRYLESAAAPAFGPAGELLGWYGTDRDITERIRMQQALLDSEARLRSLFASMSDVILVLDAKGAILEIAPTNPDPRYRPAESELGKTAHDLFPSDLADYLHQATEAALERGEAVQVEYWMPIRDGQVRLAATISPLSPDTVLLVARDITAQVEQRERALAAERARADLAEHLNEEINHRARNNLAMVSGLLQTQASQESDPRVSARLREAIARIRTFVDIHERIYAVGVERVDLLEVIRQVGSTLCALFAEVGAECAVEGVPGLLPTRSATNLAVIVNELITNALKYGGPGPEGRTRVVIRLARAEGKLRIAVWNSGNPVPEGFDPAAQKGMGLRLVAGMVAQSGGTFEIGPEGGGTLAEVVVDVAVLEAYG